MSKIPMFPNKFAIFASVLGVISGVSQYNITSQITGANDLPNGMAVLPYELRNTFSNTPFPGEIFVIITIVTTNTVGENSRFQIAWRDNKLKYRVHWTDTWGEWKEI